MQIRILTMGLFGLGIVAVACTPPSSERAATDPVAETRGPAADEGGPRMVAVHSAFCAACERMKPLINELVGRCDAKGVEAGSDKGLTLRGMRDMAKLDIIMDDHTVRFGLDQALTAEARHILGVPAEDLGGF